MCTPYGRDPSSLSPSFSPVSCSFLRYERSFSWRTRVRDCHVTKRIHSVPHGIPYVEWRWEKKQAGITLGGSKGEERGRWLGRRSERRRRIAGRNVAVRQFVECPVISGEQQSGLLRNSGGGTGLRFLTAPNWLPLPASVRLLACCLLGACYCRLAS